MRIRILLSVLACLLLTPSAFAEERLLELRAKKFSYTPNIVEVNKGDVVNIRLISEDVHHGFYLDGYSVTTSAHPGQDGNVKFVADKTGRFSFRCSVTCGEFHPYMVGYLVVGPNSRFLVYVFLTIALGVVSFAFIAFRRR